MVYNLRVVDLDVEWGLNENGAEHDQSNGPDSHFKNKIKVK